MNLEELQAKVSACVKDMLAAHRAGLKVSAADAIYKHFGLDEVNSWDAPQSITVLLPYETSSMPQLPS